MRALPLAEHPLLRATDFGEAKQALIKSWRSHHLERVGQSTDVDFKLNGVALREMSVSAMTFGAEVRSEDVGEFGMFAVFSSLSGRCVVRSGDEEVAVRRGRAAVLSATGHILTHWSPDCSLLIFGFTPEGIEHHLTDMLGVPAAEPVQFQLEMDTSVGRGRDFYIRGLNPLVKRLERRDQMAADADVLAYFEAFVTRTLLMAQPNNYTDQLRALMSD
jgi:hypothetical protein